MKFWNIGNEPWGTFQFGYTPLKYYVFKHNEFAKAMRNADPSITLIASGKMLDDMFLTGETRIERTGNLQPLFGPRMTGRAAFGRTAGETLTASRSTGTRVGGGNSTWR